MTVLTAPPKRQRTFEPVGPVADRLGISVDRLRDIAKHTGFYTRMNPAAPKSPFGFTAEQEQQIQKWIVANGQPKPPAPPEPEEDYF